MTLEHGGAPLIQKDPQRAIVYLLEWDPRKKEPLWWVIYGKSGSERKGLCVINARTGAFISAGKQLDSICAASCPGAIRMWKCAPGRQIDETLHVDFCGTA